MKFSGVAAKAIDALEKFEANVDKVKVFVV